MAAARYPARASAGSWWRHEYQDSGNPCTSSTKGPSPSSTRWMRMPRALTTRCLIAARLGGAPDVCFVRRAVAGGPEPRHLTDVHEPQVPLVALGRPTGGSPEIGAVAVP